MKQPSTSARTGDNQETKQLKDAEARSPTKRAHVQGLITGAIRGLKVVFLIALVVYGSYGILTNNLVLPAKGGGVVAFHGYPAWVIYVSILFCAIYLFYDVFGGPDSRQKVKYWALASLTTCMAGVALAVYQNSQEFVCQDVEGIRVEIPPKRSSALVVRRYCAMYNPMNSSRPNVRIFLVRQDSALTNSPPWKFSPFIQLGRADVDSLRWEDGKLLVSFHALEPENEITPQSLHAFPVPVVLIRSR